MDSMEIATMAGALTAVSRGAVLDSVVSDAYTLLKDRLVARRRDQDMTVAVTPADYINFSYEDPGANFAEVLSALRAEAGISLRALEPKVGKSAATLSRIFSGKIMPTRSVLGKILTAMETPTVAGQQIMQLWAAAMSANAGPSKPRASAAAEDEQETDIVVHGGSITFTDKAATSGRIITIHGGEVLFSPEAARAARQIIVHGGAVEVGNQPSSHSSQRDDEANRDGEDPPATGGHLRAVS